MNWLVLLMTGSWELAQGADERSEKPDAVCCRSCGSQMERADRFCTACGSPASKNSGDTARLDDEIEERLIDPTQWE